MCKQSTAYFWEREIYEPLLVRGGASVQLRVDHITGNPRHVASVVCLEMFMQICRTYRSLPDPLELDADDIELFYEAIRPELEASTKNA